MSTDNTPYRCAIVGLGPRGLFALEQLLSAFSPLADMSLTVAVYESSEYPGCGPNYAPDQPTSNQLNMPLREIPILARDAIEGGIVVAPFGSFNHWYQTQQTIDDEKVDHFPPRSAIGCYLQDRLSSLLAEPTVDERVTIYSTKVVDVVEQTDGIEVVTIADSETSKYDEVLLCIGHQPTQLDEAMSSWCGALKNSDERVFYTSPYPSNPIVEDPRINANTSVALRGMGLSMIDTVKSLTVARGGEFDLTDSARIQLTYSPSGKEPRQIAPYSLDGAPMAPKPVNQMVDSRFRPIDEVIYNVERRLSFDTHLPSEDTDLRNLLIDVVCDATVDVYRAFEAIEHSDSSPEYVTDSVETIRHVSREWLRDESFSHSLFVDTTQPTVVVMQRFLDMSLGICPPSLDYCIGQVWRHLQPSLYQKLSFQSFDANVINLAMSLDQRLKRYAFGPPVEAIARLISLCHHGLLKFRIADDPSVELHDKGWQFKEGSDFVDAQCLINTVLSPASAEKMNSELVLSLVKKPAYNFVHENLGLRALPDSRLEGSQLSLSAAGRLIVGSVFEADALFCSFGDDLPRWAEGVALRSKN